MSTPLPELPDFCWPVDTSVCATDYDAWEVEPVEADPEADPPVEAVEGVPVYSDEVKAYAEAMAGQTMRLLTGFRVGGCPITVRPCRAGCDDPTYRSYPAQGASGSTPWYPVQLGGNWLNIGCGLHLGACGCTGVEAIRLSSIVGAITEVKIDGAVLDESAYRLDHGGILVRIDGEMWPLCQHIDAPDTEPGTWSVSYTPGELVDGIGATAAGLLALEYAKACSASGKCSLPAGVQTIARGGVTMTLAVDVFPNGRTGIVAVDTYLERWNPHGLRSRPVVWSPDRHLPRGTRG